MRLLFLTGFLFLLLTSCDGDSTPDDAGTDGGDVGPDARVPIDAMVARDGGAGVDGGGSPPSGWAPQPWEDCEGGGRDLEAGPGDYRSMLGGLLPGDTLRLRPGTYREGLPISVSGEEGRCIVIEALDLADRPLFEGSDAFNIIAIRGASWLKVRNFDIDGLGLDGFGVASQGGESMPTHHVVVEGMDMTGLDGSQQIVGISTKSPAWDWVIRGNRIVGAGTGMYLGNSDGNEPFIRGVVEFNTVLDTIGYCAQIKHQNPRPSLAGIPGDGSQTIIRYNVFSKVSGSSTGGGARPNLLLGHFPASGDGRNDRYLVYGNFFYDNATEMLMQAEGNLAIYANVFVNPSGGALTIRPHNDVPREVDVFLNTILAEGRGLSVSGGDPSFSQRVRYNAIFGPTPLRADDEVGNVLGATVDASGAFADPTAMPGAGLDLHPDGASLVSTVDLAELPDVLDRMRDFDGLERDTTRVGAYGGPTSAASVPLGLVARPWDREL